MSIYDSKLSQTMYSELYDELIQSNATEDGKSYGVMLDEMYNDYCESYDLQYSQLA